MRKMVEELPHVNINIVMKVKVRAIDVTWVCAIFIHFHYLVSTVSLFGTVSKLEYLNICVEICLLFLFENIPFPKGKKNFVSVVLRINLIENWILKNCSK